MKRRGKRRMIRKKIERLGKDIVENYWKKQTRIRRMRGIG